MTLDVAALNSTLVFHYWTGQRTVAVLGTNAGSNDLAFQEWRRFKEAFAPELIERSDLR